MRRVRGLFGAATCTALLIGCAVEAPAPERIVVYSFTSRIKIVEKAFEAANPGTDLVAVDLSSSRAIARLVAEQDAGQARVDVLYLADAPVVIGRLLAERRIETYVPPRLAAVLDSRYRSPLLAQRLSTKVLLYNGAVHPTPPVSNLWELTQPAWRGRLILVDPTQRGDYLDLLTEFALREREMAGAHRQLFGRDVRVDPDLEGAGEQFIRALFRNDPVIVSSTAAVNNAIGGAGARRPLIGFGTYSDRRDNKKKGWALEAVSKITPASGISYPVLLAVARGAPNPAGARRVIDFMMGDGTPDGGAAFAPFYVPGEYPTRRDIVSPQGALPLERLGVWPIDPVRTAAARRRVADLLLVEM